MASSTSAKTCVLLKDPTLVGTTHDCGVGGVGDATILQFYKNGQRAKTTRVYKYLDAINVTDYDSVVIYPSGFLPHVYQEVKGARCRVLVSQTNATFAHTVDLTDIETLDLTSDLYANRAIVRTLATEDRDPVSDVRDE